MQKAIFLDRDGIVNHELGDYVRREEDFKLNESLVPFLMDMQKRGFVFIVISNQGGLAKGLYDHSFLDRIHTKLISGLSEQGIALKEIYYCPHHPDYGKCICRKPDSLLIEKALSRFDIDAEHSWFIGDNARDMVAAEKAGVKGILVDSNADLRGISGRIV
jgi:D-glycero-D-manno-heptose 1,7-bisphosphate phosphatase